MLLRLRRPAPLAVALAFAVPLVVLLASVRTVVGYWDTADLQTVVWIAGIPYPTGFPGYVLIGWLWTHAIPVATVAARINALSAVAVAAGAGTVAWIALMLDAVPLVAALAGWLFALSPAIWQRGAYADVHPVGFAVAFAAVALALRWELRGDARALAAAIVTAGAALAIDDTTVLILTGAVVLASGRALPVRLTLRSAAAAVLVVAAAYAYLPLRSAYVTAHRADPTLALGIPPGRPFWDDHHPSTAAGFRALVTGTEWSPGSTLARLATPSAVRAAAARYGPDLREAAPAGLLLAAVAGVVLIALDAPLVAIALVAAALVPALFGASYRAEADPERYVFALYAVLAIAIAVAASRAVRAFGTRAPFALAAAAVLLALALAHDVARGAPVFAGRSDPSARELGEQVAAATRPDAVVVAPWDWATPLAYRAYVERRLGARIVVCALPLDHLDDYAAWMAHRQVAIVSSGAPDLPGYRTRRIADGDPQVYEIVR